MISTDSACPVVPVLTISYCAVDGVAAGVSGDGAIDAFERTRRRAACPRSSRRLKRRAAVGGGAGGAGRRSGDEERASRRLKSRVISL